MRPPSVHRSAALVAAGALALAGCSSGDDEGYGEVPARPSTTPSSGGSPSTSPSASSPAPRSTTVPELAVEEVADGLDNGWDIGFLPDGSALVTERSGRISRVSSLRKGADVTRVSADLDDLYVNSEGGLMGMVVHPDFATSRQFTTCQTHARGGAPDDIRLVTWKLAANGRSAERVRTLLDGLPLSTGRHSGCRPELDATGALVVGTGDTANGRIPQDLTSLGGKTLRLNLETGKPMPDNPFADAKNANQRYVTSYGHRNVQGVALQPGTGRIFTAEHGPSFNDEVNVIEPGANYGWDPAQGGSVGGYDESVPMTDTDRYPKAVRAIWQSGKTTQAVCAAEFLEGEQWGAFDGALVITALKGAKLLVLTLDEDGSVADVAIPKATNGPYGRLRAARLGPDGALYVTTSNGDDDKLLRISPRT
ncbi:PQQ-dependent sugar dehydrogenase [Phycicoccus sonneratiae]|uniref:PQQ-dependent sugar dehydrogenase n=1 Tax=Phycicoccus sonneratiae TaxID=2807628 RepID=A0ABS2CNT5_9MICO|nr:PQQ-dependent sugar dehydrogenase [Phycicoccus sonneraticus]MBM6401537.1 PQQ-dependent sugar dehydrogenase [Phycicoccus sonneraticus]